jgi:putative ABC transport system permease protein
MTQRLVASRQGVHGTLIVGSTPDLEKVRKWKVTFGKFITEQDLKGSRPVCLIGQTVRRKLFPDKPDPVGEFIRIDRVQLKIIGILGEKGRMPTGQDQDDQVFMPITTMQSKLVSDKRISIIVSAARSDEILEKAKNEITKILRERHHIRPGGTEDFDVSTVREMAEWAVIVTTVMQILITIIASISLVVGGIGIMNIMLVSVTERTREIGIRMAIGATPYDVLVQFLIEAVVLALVGGIIGITLGLGASIALGRLVDWPVVIQPDIVLLSFLVAAGVGIFFGYYPALKASRLDPIEALRYE